MTIKTITVIKFVIVYLLFEGVPVDRCGVSGTTTCCDDRVRREGVDASEEAREDGRLEGVDMMYNKVINK